MTIKELARLCGVSPATVSRALHGQAPVRAEVKVRIEQIVRETGYRPKAIHRTRKKITSGMIGVLVPEFAHSFFTQVMLEIDRQLLDYNKMMLAIPLNWLDEAGRISELQKLPLEGIILLHEEISKSSIRKLRTMNLSMVMCGSVSISREFSAVHIDDLGAAYDGANYLLGLGHRKIGFITDTSQAISSGFQRITGSKKAMEQHGAVWNDAWFYSKGTTFEDGYAGAKHLLSRFPELTALFVFSDDGALGALHAARECGRRVPEDLSVLGFDDTLAAARALPPLTSIHQPIPDIVAHTLEILLRDISQGSPLTAAVTLPHQIVERESCRRIFDYEV